MKFILYLYCGYLYCVNCKNAYHNIRLAYAIIIHYTRFLSREQQIFSYNEHKKNISHNNNYAKLAIYNIS